MREAKRRSFWDNPREGYETAVQDFARALLTDAGSAAFRDELTAVVAKLDPPARVAAIAQTILQITVPGTPDIYQGTEFWDYSLVDPDNRRPVDYPARTAALEKAGSANAGPPDLKVEDAGSAKLAVTHRLLRLRADKPELFASGDYRPLDLDTGWLGFTRSHGNDSLVVAVPIARFAGSPGPSLPQLPHDGIWRDVLTGRTLEAGAAIDLAFPFIVAIRT